MKTILLVEDNSSDEKLTTLALARSGVPHELRVARDGAAALAAMFEPSGPLPALVLLDLNLPKLSGHEVLRRLRLHPTTRMLPIVVLTASGETKDLEQCYCLGANAYVRKPVSFELFVEAARALGDFWLRWNEGCPR